MIVSKPLQEPPEHDRAGLKERSKTPFGVKVLGIGGVLLAFVVFAAVFAWQTLAQDGKSGDKKATAQAAQNDATAAHNKSTDKPPILDKAILLPVLKSESKPSKPCPPGLDCSLPELKPMGTGGLGVAPLGMAQGQMPQTGTPISLAMVDEETLKQRLTPGFGSEPAAQDGVLGKLGGLANKGVAAGGAANAGTNLGAHSGANTTGGAGGLANMLHNAQLASLAGMPSAQGAPNASAGLPSMASLMAGMSGGGMPGAGAVGGASGVFAEAGADFAKQLNSTKTPAAIARALPDPSLIALKGQGTTCVLDTAFSNENPGFVRCVLDYPLYSGNGQVILLERGSTLDGEFKSGTDRGVRSVFIVWTLARSGSVEVQLDSPATDALGRGGVGAQVNSRFWDRFKGAFLFSVFQDSVNVAANRAINRGTSSGGSSVVLFPQTMNATNTGVAEVLKRDADIKDELVINHGKVVGVTLARDLDFTKVYRLRARAQSNSAGQGR